MVNKEQQENLVDSIFSGSYDQFYKAMQSPDIDVEYRIERLFWHDSVYEDMTPLYLAGRIGRIDHAIGLISVGADVQASVIHGSDTPIHHAVRSANRATFYAMLPRLRNPDLQRPDGTTLLDDCLDVSGSAIDILESLLRVGASPNLFGESFDPPLFRTVAGDNAIEEAKLLLKAGADMSLKNIRGQSLLEYVTPDLKAFYLDHIESLRKKLSENRDFGAPVSLNMPQENAELLQVAGAGLLPEMFAAERWRGAENEAIDMYQRVKQALPEYYKEKLATEVDLAPLRRNSGISVRGGIERLKRADAQTHFGGRTT